MNAAKSCLAGRFVSVDMRMFRKIEKKREQMGGVTRSKLVDNKSTQRASNRFWMHGPRENYLRSTLKDAFGGPLRCADVQTAFRDDFAEKNCRE